MFIFPDNRYKFYKVRFLITAKNSYPIFIMVCLEVFSSHWELCVDQKFNRRTCKNEIVLFSRFSFRGAERLYHALYFDYIFLLKTESLDNAILAF